MKLKKTRKMKKGISIFKIVVAVAIILAPVLIHAQDLSGDTKLTCDKSWSVSPTSTLKIETYDSDTKFSTWEKSEVRIMGELVVTGISKEDFQTLSNAFAKLMDGSNGNSIDTKLIESSKSLFGTKTKLELYDGSNISVGKIKITYKLWMPASMSLDLSSKYNNVSIASLNGNVSLDLYDCDVEMGDYSTGTFQMKYSKISIGNGGNTSFDVYDSKVRAQNVKNLKIESKYSNYTIASALDVRVNSYDDDFDFKNLKTIEAKASYSLFILDGQIGNSIFDIYDTDVKGGSYSTLAYSAKYSELVAKRIESLSIKAIYDCTLRVDEINDFICDESKYDEVYFGTVGNSFVMPDTYDVQIKINKLLPSFTKFDGDFKYGTIRLAADPLLNYKLSYDGTYGSIDYPKEKFSQSPLVHIEKDSKVQFEGSTSQNPKCTIKFKSYDVKFSIE